MPQRFVTLWAGALASFAVAAILFAPLSVTLDGYSHLYHAEVLRSFLDGNAPAHGFFEIQSPLLPNWLTALTLAALASFLPPPWALSLLIAAAFLASLHGLARAARAASQGELPTAAAVIVLAPFALSGFLTMGFLGYVISTAIAFHILAAVLESRHPASWARQALLAAGLLLAYFFHPFPVLISFLFVPARLAADYAQGVRPTASLLAPWAPALLLLAWFSLRLNPGPQIEDHDLLAVAIERLVSLGRPKLFTELAPTPTATVPYLLLMGALGAALLGQALRRRALTLLLLAGSALFAYVITPDGAGDAARIAIRLLLWALTFLALAALASGLRNPRTFALCGALATACVFIFCAEYWLVASRLAPAVSELSAAMRHTDRDSSALLLGYEQYPACPDWGLADRAAPQRHWALLPAADAGLIVLNDYQPATTHFPLRYRDQRFAPLIDELWSRSSGQREAWSALLAYGEDLPAFVIVWGVPNVLATDCGQPAAPPLSADLELRYERVYENDSASYAAIWRRRR